MPKIGAFWIPKTGNPDFLGGNLDADFADKLAGGERGPKGEYKVFLKRSKSENPKAPQWELHVSTPRDESRPAYQAKPSATVAPAKAAQATAAAREEEGLPF